MDLDWYLKNSFLHVTQRLDCLGLPQVFLAQTLEVAVSPGEPGYVSLMTPRGWSER